jgi:uncharacterized protein YjbJ (UPF0337 family)
MSCIRADGQPFHSAHEGRPIEEIDMDKDRIEGAAKQAKGKLKETWGKVTGDAKTEAEGKADKAEGRVQNAVGGMKDAARETRDKVTGKE